MLPKINILTRTSNRPIGFRRCAESISNQTYKNINHIVSYDTNDDLKYLNEYSNIQILKIDPEEIKAEVELHGVPEHVKRMKRFAPYNLYMNKLLDMVSDGWIMILDDDDCLAHANVIENIISHITNEDTILIWKMKFADGRVLPLPEFYASKVPALGKIGSPCFLFHSKWKDHARWDPFKGGDFRYLNNIYNSIPYSNWIDAIYVHLSPNGPGFGTKKDI